MRSISETLLMMRMIIIANASFVMAIISVNLMEIFFVGKSAFATSIALYVCRSFITFLHNLILAIHCFYLARRGVCRSLI